MGKARPGETWRNLTFAVPEDVRVLVEYAVELALLCGANSRVEALEYLAANFIAECEQQQGDWHKRATSPEAQFRLQVLSRDGWRCAMCKTSRTLTVHHIVTREHCRDTGRLDLLVDPDNGITLCNADHMRIQPRHADYADQFFAHVALRKEAP